MNDGNKAKMEADNGEKRGFLASLLVGLVRDAVKLIVSFAIGTAAGAVVCWYYGIPLAFSIFGGILVLAMAPALSPDSLFS